MQAWHVAQMLPAHIPLKYKNCSNPKCLVDYTFYLKRTMGYPGSSVIKNMLAMQETWVQSLGLEDPLEEGIATHSSILPRESHGQRNLEGGGPQGRKEWDTTEATKQQQGELSGSIEQEASCVLFWICQEPCGPYWFLNIQELRGEARLSQGWGIQAFLITVIGTLFLLMKRWLFVILSLIGIILCFLSLEF